MLSRQRKMRRRARFRRGGFEDSCVLSRLFRRCCEVSATRGLVHAWISTRASRRESTQGPSNPPRPNLARRRILRCRLSIAVYLESGRAVERRSRVRKPRAGCESNLRRIRTESARLDEPSWGRAGPLGLMKAELERDMKLMGCIAIGQLSRDNLRLR